MKASVTRGWIRGDVLRSQQQMSLSHLEAVRDASSGVCLLSFIDSRTGVSQCVSDCRRFKISAGRTPLPPKARFNVGWQQWPTGGAAEEDRNVNAEVKYKPFTIKAKHRHIF